MRAVARPALLAALLAAVAWLAACALAGAPAPAQPGATTMRSYAIPGFGTLELDVPTDWKDAVEAIQDGQIRTIDFTPSTGDAFAISLTAAGNFAGHRNFTSPARIRRIVEEQGRALLRSAVETSLTVKSLTGSGAQGFYYTLTDRATVGQPPQPGNYPYLTRGGVSAGGLLLSFGIYTRNSDAPEREAALAVIAGARHIAGPGSAPPPGGTTR